MEAEEQDFSGLIDIQEQLQQDAFQKWAMEPRGVLAEIELQMRGLYYKKGDEIITARNPMLTSEGIAEIMVILRSHLNHNNLQSVISKEMCYELTRNCMTNINKKMLRNKRKSNSWGITRDNWSIVNLLIRNQILLFLTRAIDGKERTMRNESYNMTETAKPSIMQRGRDMFTSSQVPNQQEGEYYANR